MRKTDASRLFSDRYRSFLPSDITLIDCKSGETLRESSLVAAEVEQEELGQCGNADCEQTQRRIRRYLAAGTDAEAYAGRPGVEVFSPLREGQVAHTGAAWYMMDAFLEWLRPKRRLFRPLVCVHTQPETTEAQERALVELFMLAGRTPLAKQVFLYEQTLSQIKRILHENKNLSQAVVIHIEPQEQKRT